MKRIPLIKPEISWQKLAHDFKRIIKSGILTRGPYLVKFETKLAKYLKVKKVLATSSCTTALHLALAATRIKAGDEVLVSDFTFPATGNVVIQVGAKPVLVDINLLNFCLDIEDLKKKITAKSKAIIVVHAFGYPANMTEIMKIARENKLLVIEDAACALGSKHKSKYCGTWGDVGCFSFHPRKNITTGEGGAIVTDDLKLAQRIEMLRNHGGIYKNGRWEFVEAGFNYRLSELQAALGLEQLAKIYKITKLRQKKAQVYLKYLSDIKDIVLPSKPKDGDFNFQSMVICSPQNFDRDKLIKFLKSKQVESTLGTYALHTQKSYEKYGYKPGDLPNSYYAYKHSLTLPLFGQMTEDEIKYVVENLKKFLK